MAMIDIEYRHTDAPIEDPTVRRRTVREMADYVNDIICEMQMADISCKFINTTVAEGPNTVLINGKTVHQIIDGLEIKMLDLDEACDSGRPSMVSFGRPILEWNKDIIEDIPDTIMKNAIAKEYADLNRNSIQVIDV